MTTDQYVPPTDEGNPEYWRAGCECARAGLCYRCRAAAEMERLIQARNRDHEQAWLNGAEVQRLRTIVRSVTRTISKNETSKWKVERIVATLGGETL